MNKVLLTGASGFIGKHVLQVLANRGFNVHAVTFRKELPAFENCTWHTANLLDFTRINELLKVVKPTYLLHLAWDVTPGEYWTSIKNFAWVQASLELLRRFREQGGQRVVMAGTCAEYDWRYGYCSEFRTPAVPAKPYGICKLSLQAMLGAYSEETGLSSAWGRVFFNFGPHEHPARFVPTVIHSLLRGEPAHCTHGNQIRDFLYVRDVAEAFVALLASDVTGPVNIASGKPVTLREVIDIISQLTGRSDLVRPGSVDPNVNDPPALIADVGRLTDEVGWVPKYSLTSGLEQTVNWWRKSLRS